ncbi:MAG: preprotein translocase subunit SecY [Eubacteriales bacterium]|nr:preprotein translocase subunit SecY [Eubacteriales bacterium]
MSKTSWNKPKEKKKQIGVTILILMIMVLLGQIPTPGVNRNFFLMMLPKNPGISIYNMFSGNAMEKVSVLMLSVTPYITASIILQLMGVVIPELYEMQKDGATGQKQFKRITTITGILLGMMQALCYAVGYGRQGMLISYTWYWILLVTVIWTLGGAVTIFAGEIISEKGMGNGISFILLLNILTSYPSDIRILMEHLTKGRKVPVAVLLVIGSIFFILLLFAFVILIQETERKVMVRYSNVMHGKVKGDRSGLSIKLLTGSVTPVIFASTVLSLPSLIASLFGKEYKVLSFLNSYHWFQKDGWYYSFGVIIYMLLIVGFSFYYTDLVLNPKEIANNMKMKGGTIPGIRPGRPTEDYLREKINKATLLGAFALIIVALVPCILSGVLGINKLAFAGTSIIITSGVILEMYEKLRAERQMNKMGIFR